MVKRNTIQKQIVLDMVKELHNHPTADEVFNAIALRHPTISRGTVYRNLNSLADDGMLRKIKVPDAADRFDHFLEPHYHIKCIKCGNFEDLMVPYKQELVEEASKHTDYQITGYEVVFYGVCSKCNEKN